MIERMNFFDASRLACSRGLKVRLIDARFGCRDWCTFKFVPGGGCRLVFRDDSDWWWPTLEEMERMNWEVEPEKPESLPVWCSCDNDGESNIFFHDEARKNSDGNWTACDSHEPVYLFPTDKLTEYRLVPADQPEWPWRKFNPADMPKKDFDALALMNNGVICISGWCHSTRRWFINIPNATGVRSYLPFDEIPKPEAK